MGIKCRLLGHAYGNPEVDRSREEQGDEVVVTVRNVKVCERCGDERVVNQTREVTSVRSPDEVDLDADAATAGEESDASPVTPVDPSSTDDAPDAGPGVEPAADATDDGWETGSDEWDGVEADTDVDDAVILDDETSDNETQWSEEPEPDAEPRSDSDVPPDETPTAEGDGAAGDATGGEIVDAAGDAGAEADAAEPTREWPDHDDVGGAGGWPDHDASDEGYSATPNDGVDAAFESNGLTPEVNGSSTDAAELDGVASVDDRVAEATYASGDADGEVEGFVAAGEPQSGSDAPDDRVEFYCPNCEYTRAAGRSSLRAGDICPECKRGYIAERES